MADLDCVYFPEHLKRRITRKKTRAAKQGQLAESGSEGRLFRGSLVAGRMDPSQRAATSQGFRPSMFDTQPLKSQRSMRPTEANRLQRTSVLGGMSLPFNPNSDPKLKQFMSELKGEHLKLMSNID